ncbi:MAG TPA: acyl carrier protein [Caulobacteraceae bacterium]|jgi:acyl carrier protein|nr:acyl carrier protein [Caulobacteraceae bacterium]
MDRLKTTIAAVLEVDVAAIGDDASPETLPDWDSVKQMNIVLAVEDEFDVRFKDEAIENLSSYALIRQELASMGVALS